MHREVLVRDFLTSRLPGHVEAIHSAEIIAASGEVSPQCDIVITDRSTPPLTHMQGYRIIPDECVYGVVEVRTTLNKEGLLDACENIRKAKELAKIAYYEMPGSQRTRTAYGHTYSYTPTVGMIFAFDSIDLLTLGEHFIRWCTEHAEYEPEYRPDSIWVLGKGYYVWTDPDNGLINPTPEPGSGMLAIEPPNDEDILLPWALHLNQHFATAWMPPLRLFDYAGQHPLGTRKHAWYAC